MLITQILSILGEPVSTFSKDSVCELEADTVAIDILNRIKVEGKFDHCLLSGKSLKLNDVLDLSKNKRFYYLTLWMPHSPQADPY